MCHIIFPWGPPQTLVNSQENGLQRSTKQPYMDLKDVVAQWTEKQ